MSIPLRCPTPAPRRESIFRYLGCGNAPTPEVVALCDSLLPEFLQGLDCRACFLEVDVAVEGGVVTLSGLPPVHSAALARNLMGCSRAILFAATIGSTADRLRMQMQVRSPARAVVLDAMGTAAVEALCDSLCAEWRQACAPLQLRPRFSPGYGDLPLTFQQTLLTLLDAPRQAGITLTEGLMMLPHKSVSAIVGIGDAGCDMKEHDCAACGKRNCAFRLA